MSDPISPPRLRSSLPAVDISGFFAAVEQALQLHLDSQKWPVGTSPILVHAFPQERLAKPDDPFDVITYSCGGAELAPTSNNEDRIPTQPQLRDVEISKKMFGYNCRTMAWKENVAVVFTIWSKSNARADLIVNWFHRFMMRYAHAYRFFMARGVDRFFFLKRGRDELEKVNDQEVYKRSLVYQMRIEYIDPLLEDKTIESVTVTVGIDKQKEAFDIPKQ